MLAVLLFRKLLIFDQVLMTTPLHIVTHSCVDALRNLWAVT